jgi:hypothetical protein
MSIVMNQTNSEDRLRTQEGWFNTIFEEGEVNVFYFDDKKIFEYLKENKETVKAVSSSSSYKYSWKYTGLPIPAWRCVVMEECFNKFGGFVETKEDKTEEPLNTMSELQKELDTIAKTTGIRTKERDVTSSKHSNEYQNLKELERLCESFIGKSFKLEVSFNGVSLPIINPNLVGDLLEDLFYPFYKKTCSDFERGPKQQPPDFYAGGRTFRFEQKAFYGSPGFDISNFTSFVNQLSEPGGLENKIFKTKYLVYEYGVNGDDYIIKKFWLLNIWDLPSYDNKYPISMQVKKGMWYNIRPGVSSSWSDKSKTPEKFINNILECIDICEHLEKKDEMKLSIITQFEKVKTQGFL